jgi:hypothetical protein
MPLKIEEQQTYLGVTFDKRMTWKQHITSAEAMARRKMNIMRKLAGTKWFGGLYHGFAFPSLT